MKTKKIGKNVAFALLGLFIALMGVYLDLFDNRLTEILTNLPPVCYGIGSGILGGNLAIIIGNFILNKHPALAKENDINEKDERHVTIRNKAKSKSYDLMILVYGALILVLTLMNVTASVMFTVIIAYLFVMLSNIYYLGLFSKEL